jgi:hypothetical protein
MVHEWHIEYFRPRSWWGGKVFNELPERLAELESQGFEIFSVVESFQSESANIIYRKPAEKKECLT